VRDTERWILDHLPPTAWVVLPLLSAVPNLWTKNLQTRLDWWYNVHFWDLEGPWSSGHPLQFPVMRKTIVQECWHILVTLMVPNHAERSSELHSWESLLAMHGHKLHSLSMVLTLLPKVQICLIALYYQEIWNTLLLDCRG
jgi:hypothetical protein